jgi:hypothetical protein
MLKEQPKTYTSLNLGFLGGPGLVDTLSLPEEGATCQRGALIWNPSRVKGTGNSHSKDLIFGDHVYASHPI